MCVLRELGYQSVGYITLARSLCFCVFRSRLLPVKSALFSKIPRVLLAFIVSVWMAGGCLFGCSNMQAMGAETVESSDIVVEDESCEPAAAHSCCTKPKQAKQPANQPVSNAAPITTRKEALPTAPSGTLTTAPRGMADCPLMVNTTAVTSKSSGNMPEPGRTPVALLPRIESQLEQAPVTIATSYQPNRGPTHLRCCVFLI